MSFDPEDDITPSAAEEAELLRQVLHDISSLGYNPSKLQMITTWLQNSEVRDQVEQAVFESGEWKSCRGRKYCYQAEHVTNQFLSSVDAFKEFDVPLREYGLRRKAVHVDDMAVGEKGKRVFCQGLLVISLESENGD
jgi:hypothetical protein